MATQWWQQIRVPPAPTPAPTAIDYFNRHLSALADAKTRQLLYDAYQELRRQSPRYRLGDQYEIDLTDLTPQERLTLDAFFRSAPRLNAERFQRYQNMPERAITQGMFQLIDERFKGNPPLAIKAKLIWGATLSNPAYANRLFPQFYQGEGDVPTPNAYRQQMVRAAIDAALMELAERAVPPHNMGPNPLPFIRRVVPEPQAQPPAPPQPPPQPPTRRAIEDLMNDPTFTQLMERAQNRKPDDYVTPLLLAEYLKQNGYPEYADRVYQQVFGDKNNPNTPKGMQPFQQLQPILQTLLPLLMVAMMGKPSQPSAPQVIVT